MAAIRRWPSESRCSVAANPPAQLVAPTDGMSAGGVLAGSITTSGMPAPRSWLTWASVTLVITRITPSLWWLAIVEVQLAGRASPCRTDETAIAVPRSAPHSSTPRRISTAHGLSRPMNTRSMRPERRLSRGPLRGDWCRSRSCSTPALVAGETSGRPFTTFDTVGSETPASAAMAASVVFRTASPFGLISKFLGSVDRLNCAVLAASYANRQVMKMFVTPWKRGVDRTVARPYDDGTSKVLRKLSKVACVQSPGDDHA